MPRWMAPLILITSLLAGCSGTTDTPPSTGPGTSVPLSDGKGGIMGLLVNDVFRPVPGGLVFIEKFGLTTTTDAAGQFVFTGLDPGSYVLLATALNHEATPIPVDVVEGKYAEVEIEARRTFSQDGDTVTSQYSVFIPCSTADPTGYGTYSIGCLGDPDSYRPGLQDLNFSGLDITYLVVEVKVNHKDFYEFQLREDDGTSGGGDRWGKCWINGTDYCRVILKVDENYMGQSESVEWKNQASKPMAALLFYVGQGKGEATGLPAPVGGLFCCGAGVKFAVKANIVLTAFIGPPTVDVDSYQVLGPDEE